MDLLAEAAVPEQSRAPLQAWLDLVRTWNKRIDLTAARDARELVDLMVADALVLSMHVPQGVRVVDVGSGAGAPGFALAILRPDLKVTLVEPLTKRASFLRTAIGTLARTDVELVRGKAEGITRERGRAFDVAISRATLPPPSWLVAGLALAPTVWTLLARDEPPTAPNATLDQDLVYTWPLGGATRRAVRHVLQQATQT